MKFTNLSIEEKFQTRKPLYSNLTVLMKKQEKYGFTEYIPGLYCHAKYSDKLYCKFAKLTLYCMVKNYIENCNLESHYCFRKSLDDARSMFVESLSRYYSINEIHQIIASFEFSWAKMLAYLKATAFYPYSESSRKLSILEGRTFFMDKKTMVYYMRTDPHMIIRRLAYYGSRHSSEILQLLEDNGIEIFLEDTYLVISETPQLLRWKPDLKKAKLTELISLHCGITQGIVSNILSSNYSYGALFDTEKYPKLSEYNSNNTILQLCSCLAESL